MKINFSLEKNIQAFFLIKLQIQFQNIKYLKEDEKRRIKLEEIERIEKEKILKQKHKKQEEEALNTKIQRKSFKGRGQTRKRKN